VLDLNQLFERAEKELWSRDYLGYTFEMRNIEVLRQYGFYKFLDYHNPKEPYAWKRKKKVGVDMILKVHDYTIYVEETYNSARYYFRRKWFDDSRIPRFKGFPHDNFHLWIVLTNRPRNFNSVKEYAENLGIQIVNINGLFSLIRDLINKTLERISSTHSSSTHNSNTLTTSLSNNKHTTSNNVYPYEETLEDRVEKITRYNPEKELELMLKLRKLRECPDYIEFS